MAKGQGSSLGAVGVFGQHIYWDSGGSIDDTTMGNPSIAHVIGGAGPGLIGSATVEVFALRGPKLYFIDDGVNVARARRRIGSRRATDVGL
jgi:hypothetical protein